MINLGRLGAEAAKLIKHAVRLKAESKLQEKLADSFTPRPERISAGRVVEKLEAGESEESDGSVPEVVGG